MNTGLLSNTSAETTYCVTAAFAFSVQKKRLLFLVQCIAHSLVTASMRLSQQPARAAISCPSRWLMTENSLITRQIVALESRWNEVALAQRNRCYDNKLCFGQVE